MSRVTAGRTCRPAAGRSNAAKTAFSARRRLPAGVEHERSVFSRCTPRKRKSSEGNHRPLLQRLSRPLKNRCLNGWMSYGCHDRTTHTVPHGWIDGRDLHSTRHCILALRHSSVLCSCLILHPAEAARLRNRVRLQAAIVGVNAWLTFMLRHARTKPRVS